MGGTAVMEPIVRRFMNVIKGRGLLKRSDEAGEALEAVEEINLILKDLDIKNATFVYGRNKINNPVGLENYASDSRTNSIDSDL